MSNGGKSGQQTYASGLLREFLRGDLKDKPNEVLEPVSGLIGDEETLRLIMHYRSIWPRTKRKEQARRSQLREKAKRLENAGKPKDAEQIERRLAELGELPESFGETRLARTLVRNASSVNVDEAVRAGNVSQMQNAIGLTRNSGDAADALHETVRRLSDEGTIAIIVGPPGAGKTATTLDIARAWGARTGGYLVGNTSWHGYDAVVSSDVEMLEWMGSHERQVLGVIDETADALSGRGQGSKEAEAFADRGTLIRKKEAQHGSNAKRGSLLLVGHTMRRLAAPIRRMATLFIQKPSRNDPGKVVLYESTGGQDDTEKIGEFTGLTDTRESYPEHEASSFRIVLDEDDGEGGDGPDADAEVRKAHIETVVRACKPWSDEEGMSYPDAAELVPYGDSWVGNRVREWSGGDYRDVVADPTD